MGKLKSVLRNVALTTKLPCSQWYDNDVINFGLNNEIEIYPMTHSDEILMHNPDALFSNNAVSKIIQSCCPDIKNANMLYMPDVETILLAIKIASIGNELEIYNVCSNCFEKYNTLSNEERNKLIEDKKLSIEPQTFLFDARTCLETVQSLPDNFIVDIKDNIKVYIKPLTLFESTEYEINDFNIKNAIQKFILESKEYDERAKMLNDVQNWQENREKNEEFNQLLLELDKIVIKMIKASIKYIKLDDEILTDQEDFDDLLSEIGSNKFEEIKTCVDEANKSRLIKTFNCECKYCGHTWSNDNINFNFSNFFGKGS